MKILYSIIALGLSLTACAGNRVKEGSPMDKTEAAVEKYEAQADNNKQELYYVDIEEQGLDGKMHKLSEWVGKGNYVLIDFWASWCGPCCREMPNVVANYEKYHSKGFEVVGLSLDKDDAAWRGAIKRLGLNWVHLSDLKGWESYAAQVYGVQSIPASLLVDPEGKVVAVNLRGEELGKALEKIYK